MFQLAFPQPEMLKPEYLYLITSKMREPGVSKIAMQHAAESIRARMNPHPAGQKQESVPRVDGTQVPGMQHKYRETVLFFPAEV